MTFFFFTVDLTLFDPNGLSIHRARLHGSYLVQLAVRLRLQPLSRQPSAKTEHRMYEIGPAQAFAEKRLAEDRPLQAAGQSLLPFVIDQLLGTVIRTVEESTVRASNGRRWSGMSSASMRKQFEQAADLAVQYLETASVLLAQGADPAGQLGAAARVWRHQLMRRVDRVIREAKRHPEGRTWLVRQMDSLVITFIDHFARDLRIVRRTLRPAMPDPMRPPLHSVTAAVRSLRQQ